MRHIASVFTAVLILGCSSAPVEPDLQEQASATTVAVGDTFTLRAGQIAQVAGTQVQVAFRRVEADSRCPSDVVCVWAGDAAIALEVAAARTAWVPVTLHTGVEPRRATQFGYTFELVQLTPDPRSDRLTDAASYQATLKVTRN